MARERSSPPCAGPAACRRCTLVALEVALREEDDLARNAQRVCSALDAIEDSVADVEVFVELPRTLGVPGPGWLGALDELAMRELTVKFRTGGATAEAFPSAAELAAAITAALDRELPFKCTAGLHHALRHTDPESGFEHHGFLNVLAATRASLDGGDTEAALEERDPDRLLAGHRCRHPRPHPALVHRVRQLQHRWSRTTTSSSSA